MKKILSGLDRLKLSQFQPFKGLKLGLISNSTGVDCHLNLLVDLLRQYCPGSLQVVFAPEHGFFGAAQDMEEVDHKMDPLEGIKVVSLYGNTFDSLKPSLKDLQGLDALLFDIQDVGSRYYTFANTMALAMEAARDAGLRFFVLDRPNPINGGQVEGNMVKKGFESFVGMFPIANRHGMTLGEMAEMFNQQFEINCALEVFWMEGYTRQMWFEQTGLPWVMPSPNMPTLKTAIVYPGMCLLEGTNLSEGRGTTRPFELFGAPYIDPFLLTGELNRLKLPQCVFRPLYFKPTFQKWGGQICGGAQLHLLNREQFQPLVTGLAVIHTVYNLYPDQFEWRREAYEFVDKIPAIDLLFGNQEIRKQIESHRPLPGIIEMIQAETDQFLSMRKEFLHY